MFLIVIKDYSLMRKLSLLVKRTEMRRYSKLTAPRSLRPLDKRESGFTVGGFAENGNFREYFVVTLLSRIPKPAESMGLAKDVETARCVDSARYIVVMWPLW